jgi:hypothetical protein
VRVILVRQVLETCKQSALHRHEVHQTSMAGWTRRRQLEPLQGPVAIRSAVLLMVNAISPSSHLRMFSIQDSVELPNSNCCTALQSSTEPCLSDSSCSRFGNIARKIDAGHLKPSLEQTCLYRSFDQYVQQPMSYGSFVSDQTWNSIRWTTGSAGSCMGGKQVHNPLKVFNCPTYMAERLPRSCCMSKRR